MTLEALIFDVDGTLAETERDGHRVAFNLAFAEMGLDWEWDVELYGKLLAVPGGKERIQHYIDTFCPNFEPPSPLEDFIPLLHKTKTKYYVNLVEKGAIGLRPGVLRLLQEALTNQMRLAIATTTTTANVTSLLKTTLGEDSIQWFEVIAAGDIVEYKKPHPGIYLYALEKMNLKPDQCLAFEDSYPGLQSSLNAGLKTIVTINEYTKNQNFDQGDLVLNHLGDHNLPFTVIKGDSYHKTLFDLELAKLIMDN